MAPGLIETTTQATYLGGSEINDIVSLKAANKPHGITYVPGRTEIKDHKHYEHQDLLPSFPDIHWEPLTEVPYHEKGLNGDIHFRNLLAGASDVFDHNPKIGTEVHGVKLAKLSNAQKDDLARLISVRGVVFFRNQEDLDIDAQRELGQYFGQLHKHATTSIPQRSGLEDVRILRNFCFP